MKTGMQPIHRKFSRDQRGATIIEFALVAPIFFFLTFLIVELGLLVFTQIALESATMSVSRSASIGGSSSGCDRACTIQQLVQQKTLGLINASAVVVTANLLSAGGTVTPDVCLTDPPSAPVPGGAGGTGKCPGTTLCIDNNGNGKCDVPAAMSLGNAGDLIEIRVSYPWKLQIPFLDTVTFAGNTARSGTTFGSNGVVTLSASTIIKNEPF